MMIWPPHYFDTMTLEKKSALNGVCFGHIDINPYSNDAVFYEVAAGQILFIPAGWWHYNKMEGLETTLTLSVGMFSHGTVQEFCRNPIKASIASKVADVSMGTIPQLRSRVFQSLKDVELPRQAAQFIDSIGDNCKIQMLLKLSANGIIRERATESGSASVSFDTPIAGRPDSPLFLLTLGVDSGLLFAAGEMIRVSNVQGVHNLVARLQTGISFEPHILVDEADKEYELFELLQWLHIRAAFDVRAD
ncbi:hypothetical protein D9M71_495350 [compost metagenome]